jgi:hypothetical protein
MHHLPQTIDFNAADYPELSDIFRSIDAGIAAIVATDPAFRQKQAHKRRKQIAKSSATTASARRVVRKAAA